MSTRIILKNEQQSVLRFENNLGISMIRQLEKYPHVSWELAVVYFADKTNNYVLAEKAIPSIPSCCYSSDFDICNDVHIGLSSRAAFRVIKLVSHLPYCPTETEIQTRKLIEAGYMTE